MKALATCLLAFATTIALAQAPPSKKTGQKKPPAPVVFEYDKVDQKPAPGYDINEYLIKHLEYPVLANNEGAQGRVVVEFIVKKDGTIGSVKVSNGIRSQLDEEAKRVVEQMPPWKPGKKNGKAVNVKYLLPVVFHLNEDAKSKNMLAQAEEKKKKDEVYKKVEVMPVPPYSLEQYLGGNLKYPDAANIKRKEGRVLVQFIVKTDGSISDAKVTQGFDAECDAEALRVLKAMPPWKPGKQDGKPVNVMFTLPISFKLDN